MKRESSVPALKWLNAAIGHKKIYITGLCIVQVIQGANAILLAWLLKMLVDSAVNGRSGDVRAWAIALALLTLAQVAVAYASHWLNEAALSAFDNALKKRLFGTLMLKDYEQVTHIHSGEWLNRLTNDVTVVSSGLTGILPGLLGMLVRLFGAAGMIAFLTPRFVLFALPAVLGLVAFTVLYRGRLKKLHRRIQESDGQLRSFLTERLFSLMVIRSFSRNGEVLAEAEEKMDEHRRRRLKRNRYSNACSTLMYFATKGIYTATAVYCVFGIVNGTVSYGTFTAMLQLITKIQDPVKNLSGYLPKYYAMIASAERLMEAEGYDDDLTRPEKGAEEIRRFYDREFRSLRLSGIRFSYRPADGTEAAVRVFDGMDLVIRRGEFIALTGPSGRGKSTVLKLLMCLYRPESGTRTVEGEDGIRELTGEYRGLFAYVPQGNQLMSGTIREVVTFGDREAMREPERIRRALEIACALDFVDGLEKGIDTVLGERGAGLSEGQMQRLAIARAVFTDRPVLLLDEATSSLDAATESRLLRNLREMTDKTVVIVTHRPAAVGMCDRQIAL